MSSLLRTENGLTTDIFVVRYTGRGLVVKRPGVLSKVQMLTLVLGVGAVSFLPTFYGHEDFSDFGLPTQSMRNAIVDPVSGPPSGTTKVPMRADTIRINPRIP